MRGTKAKKLRAWAKTRALPRTEGFLPRVDRLEWAPGSFRYELKKLKQLARLVPTLYVPSRHVVSPPQQPVPKS